MLKDHIDHYYFESNYNCAESLLRTANDYYDLRLHDADMKLVAGYGAGMQTGDTCGALLSAISVLSLKYVEQKAHESSDIGPAVQMLKEKILERLPSYDCREIKPVNFKPEIRCRDTVYAVCDILEETIAEYGDTHRG